jgi:hypothetical protein
MKNRIRTMALVLVLGGCMGAPPPDTGGADSSPDMTQATPQPQPHPQPEPTMDMNHPGTPPDMSGQPAGKVPYGGLCTMINSSAQCETGLICQMADMGLDAKCTKTCTQKGVTGDVAECPPPSDGKCNMNGYCRL